MNKRKTALLAALMVSSIAQADELLLEDGSRIVGTLAEINGDVVVFDTAFAGSIEVRRDAIEGLRTDGDWRVVFDSGERLVGRMLWTAEQGQQLDGDRAGALSVDVREVVAVEDPATPVIETPDQRAQAVWSSEVSVAISGASGNTDEFSATPRFSALRETEFDRIRFGLQGRFAQQDGQETENEVIGSFGLERDFSPRWFGFGGVRLERDELEKLDLRANIDAGAGVFLIRNEDHEFKPRIGLGVQTESFQGGETQEDLVGVAGWDYRIELNSNWRFTHGLDYRPTFSDPTGSYRVDSEAAFVTLLNDNRWGLSIRLRNEYNADPEPGIDELDTVYSIGLQRSFK